ncbi:MAG: hypothetical protein KDB53_00615 [Planctomycetes bacterium]|nr:hypothetical protein [Planctomycetota bacterium]
MFRSIQPSSILAVLACLATLAVAQDRPSIFDKGADTYPLGGIEALVLPNANGQFVVHKVFEKGLAEIGELAVGDVIVRVGKKKIEGKPDDMWFAIEEEIEEAEAKPMRGDKPNQVRFDVIDRAGEKAVRNVPVRALGKHSKSCPEKCKKCSEILLDALKYLEKEQSGEGHFAGQVANENHSVATVSLAALAWLGHEKARQAYAKNIENAARYVIRNCTEPSHRGLRPASTPGGTAANWDQSNWSLSYGGIFLGELLQHKKKREWLEGLNQMMDSLANNQEQSGGWAHGPGGPNALGYLELEIMSNLALGALGLAERCGVQIAEAKKIKGIEWVKSCTTNGGVAYSPKPGQMGHGDPGRTAGAVWAFSQCGRLGGITDEMADYYRKGLSELYEGHACATMHVLNGALAASTLGSRDWKAFWKVWRPFFMASRAFGGAFDYRPNEESRDAKRNSDRGWGPAFVTAHYAIAMQCGQGRYEALDAVDTKKR